LKPGAFKLWVTGFNLYRQPHLDAARAHHHQRGFGSRGAGAARAAAAAAAPRHLGAHEDVVAAVVAHAADVAAAVAVAVDEGLRPCSRLFHLTFRLYAATNVVASVVVKKEA
jgi:hypothetical protein